ncbi:MAG: hypothetical protein IJP70_11275 [Bacteroidales bacterium]|nr:hypothetical protein [Bacteroidales bacterium]
MKKKYQQPKMEGVFIVAQTALCNSISGGDNGNGRPANVREYRDSDWQDFEH